jgi:dethiobiotin synthetase
MTTFIPPLTRGVYITGTDTGVGKTLVSEVLLHRLRDEGLRAIGMKPIASGCERTPDGWRNEDALRLQAASDPRPDYDDVNPYPFAIPTAPQLAARAMGARVDPTRLHDAYARLRAQADALVVEGVGGWAAPFDTGIEQADFVRMINLPVILVVGLRLGCLNHARLTARAIEADALRMSGWIGNSIDPQFAERDDYIELLRGALPAPCLGVLPHAPSVDPRTMAALLSLPEAVS